MRKNILKNAKNTWDEEFASMITARKVENPPLNTAGPNLDSVRAILSFLEPLK